MVDNIMEKRIAWNKGLTKEDSRVMKYIQKKIGVKRTPEQRKRISDSHKGLKLSKETKEKLALARRGMRFSSGIKFDAKLIPINIKGKINHNGYIFLHIPSHPKANKQGYIYEHRLIMEKHLGRMLSNDEIVHHINDIRNDNRIENLMLFPNNGKHLSKSFKSIKLIGRLNNGQN
jgi:hypothetical protein